MSGNENWIPLLEYAVKKNISISTIRRYIKANKVIWKNEAGRYYILDNENIPHPKSGLIVGGKLENQEKRENKQDSAENHHLKQKVIILEEMLRKANEEIVELKMLVKLYEDKINNNY